MVDETETYIMSAIRKSSLIDGMFRRNITEYPRESLRESIANAVAHRDYSPYVRGSYIQIRMFANRLEVRSPGGLFGNVTVDDRRASFKVTFHNHTLMTSEAVTWLNQFSRLPLNDHQRLALVYLRHHNKITNSDYRRLNRVNIR